jgi:hypothetical protein
MVPDVWFEQTTYRLQDDCTTAVLIRRIRNNKVKMINFNIKQLRNQELASYPTEQVLELEQKFGKYCYVPLDVPNIQANNQEFLSLWFNKNSTVFSKDHQEGYNSGWRCINVFDNDHSKSKIKRNNRPDFLRLFPEIREQIYEYMPYDFTKPFGFWLWSSTKQVVPHRDPSNGFTDLPKSFRSFILDTNTQDHFYLIENNDYSHIKNDQTEKLSYAKINFDNSFLIPQLPDTNTFAWNNLRVEHGSVKREHEFKIMIYYDYDNTIDWNKYEKLFDRSVSKYQHQCMVSNHQLGYFIDNDENTLDNLSSLDN